MNTAPVDTRLLTFWLPLVIRINAVGMTIFFSVLALHSLRLIDFGEFYLSCVRWGSNGEAYELMICTVYLVWSVFLWRTARNPLAERTFLDFTVTANAAHFGLMFLLALMLPGERQHLVGDVLLGWSGLIVLIVLWLVARRFPAS